MVRTLLVLLVLEALLLAQGPPRRTPYASDCGKGIGWEQDLEAALARAKKERKAIFWFVPTAYGTALDRRQEVYWYMMGGAFSEPRVVEFINANFVPLKLGFASLVRGSDELALVPRKERRELAERYALTADQFAEPGFLVLDRRGEKVAAFDRQLTFQVDHFGKQVTTVLAPAAKRIGKLSFPPPRRDALTKVRELMAAAKFVGAQKALDEVENGLDEKLQPEARWLRARRDWITNHHDEADHELGELIAANPQTIWAARAKLELEGWGPFRHHFATPVALSEAATRTKDDRGTRIDGVERSEEERVRAAIRWLRLAQRRDGSWQDSRYDFGGLDSLPNVHVAVTAIAARGLLEWYELDPEGIETALHSAQSFLLDEKNLALRDRDELIWAQVYRLEYFLRRIELHEIHRQQLGPKIQRLIEAIETSQQGGGAYRHEYPNPFATASAIVALTKAKELGFEVAELGLRQAASALKKTRGDDGSYSYGMRGRGGEISSAGRRPLCELALFLTKRSDAKKLTRAVEVSWKHHEHFERARTSDDHTRPHGIGGFFYYYDLLGRSEATTRLAAGKRQEALKQRTRELVGGLQEIDGSFLDSHELGKSYGSGMALTILSLCREEGKQ